MSYSQPPSKLSSPSVQLHKPTPHWLPRFFGEAFLVLSVVCLVYAGLALFSYSKLDPGFTTTGQVEQVQNTVGIAGAWIANILFWLFGKSVWLLWLAFCVFVLQASNKWLRIIGLGDVLIDNTLDHPLWLRWLGLFLLMVSSTALEWSRGYAWQDSLPDHPGGAFGYWVGNLTTTYLGFFASALFLVPLFCFGLSWAFGFSWLRLARWIGQKIEFVFLEFSRKREYEEDARIGEQAVKEREKELEQDYSAEKTEWTETATMASSNATLNASSDPLQDTVTTPRATPSTPREIREPEPSQAAPKLVKEHQHSLFTDPNAAQLPQIALLDPVRVQEQTVTPETLEMTSRLIEKRLKDFGVEVKVVLASPGPVVTRYEIEPATGVKGSQIVNLAKDLARSLSLVSIRVIETIPGKNYMALELPNAKRQTISLAEILGSKVYDEAKSMLTIGLGKDIIGKPVVADLAKMPHCLVAGTTGSGKSVGINAMILSLLYKADARDVRLLLIDPKMLEMSVYEGIPHLLAPVVTDMRQAAHGLNWCVAEMEKRYKLMSKLGVRNLAGYNQKLDDAQARGESVPNPFSLTPEEPEPLERLPHIVVVIDELADLMMVVGKKIEELIARLAQKARAAGIHLILATQRPSVDVITGLIKANIPTRISFQVSSKIDSRTILDQMGAEALLGMGDMLYMPSGTGFPVRVHGAFVSDEEVHRVVDYLKEQGGEPNYIEGVLEGGVAEDGAGGLVGLAGMGMDASGEKDPMYDQAVEVVIKNRKASISLVQRHLKIGYNRAARLLEDMENAGLVSSMSGSGQREILVPRRDAEMQD